MAELVSRSPNSSLLKLLSRQISAGSFFPLAMHHVSEYTWHFLRYAMPSLESRKAMQAESREFHRCGGSLRTSGRRPSSTTDSWTSAAWTQRREGASPQPGSFVLQDRPVSLWLALPLSRIMCWFGFVGVNSLLIGIWSHLHQK